MSVPYYLTNDGGLTLLVEGKSYSVASDHPNLEKIKQGLRDNLDSVKLLKLVDRVRVINSWGRSKIEVRGGEIYYLGQPVPHKVIVNKIFQLLDEQLPADPLLNFLENLMENPRMSAREELYDFLEHQNLPITEDGHFLAYKAVQNNYLDVYSGTIDNSPGQLVKMDPGLVDDNRAVGCSRGLHCGTMSYCKSYHSSGKFVVVKVNPKNVVSVPTDCNCQKCRVCEYLVLRDFESELTKAVYSSVGDDYDDYFEEGDVQSLTYNQPANDKKAQVWYSGPNDNWKKQRRDKFGRFTK